MGDMRHWMIRRHQLDSHWKLSVAAAKWHEQSKGGREFRREKECEPKAKSTQRSQSAQAGGLQLNTMTQARGKRQGGDGSWQLKVNLVDETGLNRKRRTAPGVKPTSCRVFME